jgi:hypothetical protein
MLKRLEAEGGNLEAERWEAVFNAQQHSAIHVVRVHQHELLLVNYNYALTDPQKVADSVNDFLSDFQLDKSAMIKAVDPALYREQNSSPIR